MQGLARSTALAVALIVLFAAPATGATLEGETFYTADNGAPPASEQQCTDNGDGTTSWSVSYSGFAFGPVNGTFTETARITVGPQTSPPVGFPPFTPLLPFPVPEIPGDPDPALNFNTGPLVRYDAEFEIKDASGTVLASGTKELTTPAPTDIGSCDDFAVPGAAGYYADARAVGSLRYEATVGSTSDSGTATVLTRQGNTAPFLAFRVHDFLERFDSEVVERTPASLDLSPASATNPVGTQHTVTATVRDAEGAPLSGVRVLARVTGSVSVPFMSCTTGADGTCELTYSGPAFPGADLIEAVADSNADGGPDPGEPVDSATKAWVLPESTPGQVTGGGQVPGGAAFGFNAKSSDGDARGNCNVVDKDTATHVKCRTVDAIVRSGTHVTIYGRADVNGTEQTYRIDVEDNAEPGAGADEFRLQTSGGYSIGGTLLRGNVQVHG
jgi:hypothetical protein